MLPWLIGARMLDAQMGDHGSRRVVAAGGRDGPLAGLGRHAGAAWLVFQQGRGCHLRRCLRRAPPYVGQQAVEHYQWIAPGQTLDGSALAETTPGPLIIVLQFVGFLAAWQHPEHWLRSQRRCWGRGLTTRVTFVPTYLFILFGAPYVERVRGNVQWGRRCRP